jgi:hypothetical protein
MNHAELQGVLTTINVQVPLRSEGRTTDHGELYCIVHLLSSLPEGYWTFPLELLHSDRPDFQLRTHGRSIGVECVEAVPFNEAKRAKLREQGHGASIHFLQRATVDDPVVGSRQMKAELLREVRRERGEDSGDEADDGDGWVGDSAEREWADVVLHFARQKMDVANNPGFQLHEENWLLIYDNWPLPHLNPRKAADLFLAHPEAQSILQRFSRVFVMDGSRIWEFSNRAALHALVKSHDSD